MQSNTEPARWNGICRIGGAAALGGVLVGLVEISITFLPGGNTVQNSVVDWFHLFQANWFMGLRDLGLLNILFNTLGILTFFGLYAAHRDDRNQPYAALALLVAFLGIAVFFATNRAFAMLDLSRQYAAVESAAQRAMLEAAGQSMLSVGRSHSPGTFLGFFFLEAAGVLFSLVMLRGQLFSRVTAWVGILGFGCLLVFEILSSFIAGLNGATMLLAIAAGLLTMTWNVLIARRLFQIGRDGSALAPADPHPLPHPMDLA
ncbi:MAG TPA: hypothetical protein VMT46_11360 [Anaerolineaceae bacterium]|nr:hypothetical protein [Anaerolineaceae bacterium]